MNRVLRIEIWSIVGMLLAAGSVHAAGGGGSWTMGANIGFINSSQGDMNHVIEKGATGAKAFGNAWEGSFAFGYRLSSSSVGLLLRPSYFFYGDATGAGSKYTLSGFTIFPVLKWYMLEDKSIKFYSQFGVGYGHMSGEISVSSTANAKFGGGGMGYMAGLGAEFCFAGMHCLNIEGSMRALSVDRFIVDSATGSLAGSDITQSTASQELEINDHDFSASMSGVLGMVGYSFYF